MAKYRFICNVCDRELFMYIDRNIRTINCVCGKKMVRQIPRTSHDAIITEVIDSKMGVSLRPDDSEQATQRSEEYFWTIRVPELVKETPIKECLRNGWMYYNEKEELVVQTTPPHRR